MDASQDVHEAEKQLYELRRALPQLPHPEVLYDNIVAICREFDACTKKMTQVEARIRAACASKDSWESRRHEISLLEITCDNMRLQFLLLRCQIRTLFADPPLLVATGQVAAEVWDTWMEKPQTNDTDKPLLMDQTILEPAITDQLQLLHGYSSTLHDLCTSIQKEEKDETIIFQDEIRRAVENLQSSVDRVLQAAQNSETVNPSVQDQNDASIQLPEGEHIAQQVQREEQAIQENAEYMEEVSDMQADEEDFAQGQPQHRDDAQVKQQIQQEIGQKRQAIRNFEQIIEELRQLRTCPPRRFERGNITHELERFMRCAFCDVAGHHYSDKCMEVRSVRDRRRVLEEKRKCPLCLESFCIGGNTCKKYNTRCYHCREYDHHSAICELPEQSEEIQHRLTNAREGMAQCMERIRQLERDLLLFDDDEDQLN